MYPVPSYLKSKYQIDFPRHYVNSRHIWDKKKTKVINRRVSQKKINLDAKATIYTSWLMDSSSITLWRKNHLDFNVIFYVL